MADYHEEETPVRDKIDGVVAWAKRHKEQLLQATMFVVVAVVLTFGIISLNESADQAKAEREKAAQIYNNRLDDCMALEGDFRCVCLEGMVIEYEASKKFWEDTPLKDKAKVCRDELSTTTKVVKTGGKAIKFIWKLATD